MSTKSNDLKINRQLILNSGGANPEDYLTPKQLDRYKKNPERFIDIDVDLVKKRKGLMIANLSTDGGGGFPTTSGYFVNDIGDVFRNDGGRLIKLDTPNGYDPEYHGQIIPLAKRKNKRSQLQIA